MREELRVSTILLGLVLLLLVLPFSMELVYGQSSGSILVRDSHGKISGFFVGANLEILCFGHISLYYGEDLMSTAFGKISFAAQKEGSYRVECGPEVKTFDVAGPAGSEVPKIQEVVSQGVKIFVTDSPEAPEPEVQAADDEIIDERSLSVSEGIEIYSQSGKADATQESGIRNKTYEFIVGKPVRRISKIVISNGSSGYNITLSESASNISLHYDSELNEGRKPGFVVKAPPQVSAFSGGANASLEYLEILDVTGEVEVEYYVEGPKKTERNLSELRKEVVVFSGGEENFTNILAYSDLPSPAAYERQVKIYWKEESKFVDFSLSDTDGDSLFDYVEWIVPHLSNQTFEIILITKAEHLDSNRTFVSDIYPEVRYQDDLWSEEIPEGDYVRVTFEQNLTNESDITIYPKVISGEPLIEIYEVNGTERIAELANLESNVSNQALLTNLSESQDTFDLFIVGGSIEIDYIVDPAIENGTAGAAATQWGWEDMLTRLDSGELIAVWIDADSDLWCSNSTDGGIHWTNTEIKDAVTYATPTIISNGSRIVVAVRDSVEADIMMAYSDSGCSGAFTFVDVQGMNGSTVFAYPSIAIGPDNELHLCAIYGGDDLYYTNSTNMGQTWRAAPVAIDTTDVDYCDIEVDGNDMVWIAKTGLTNDDIEVVNSSNNFATNTNTLVDNSTGDHGISISIGNSNEVYIAYSNLTLSTFWFANSSNGVDWTTTAVATQNYSTASPDVYYDTVVKVNSNTGEIYVFFSQDISGTDYDLFYANSTNGGVSWDSRLLHYSLYGSLTADDAWYPNPRGSKYPVSNRIMTYPDYIFTSRYRATGTQYKVVYGSIIPPDYQNATGIFASATYFYGWLNQTVARVRGPDGIFSEKIAPVGTNSGAQRYWQKVRCLEKRRECLLLWEDSLNDIHFEVYNTDSGAWTSYQELTANPRDVATPHFDIECEDFSGECLIVYEQGPAASNDQIVAYRVYNGSGLSGETNYTLTNAAGIQDWIKLYPKEGSNDIMLVVEDSVYDLYAILWNGTNNSFISGTKIVATNNAPNYADRKSFDFSWEGSSGEGLFLYSLQGNNSLFAYSFNHSDFTWQNLTTINISAISGGRPTDIVACGSDPLSGGTNHDNIGIIFQTWDGVQAYTYGMMWNGTAIEAGYPTEDTTTELLTATEAIQCKWEGSSKDQAVFLWTDMDANMSSWGTYTIGSGWDIASFASGKYDGVVIFYSGLDDMVMIPRPDSDELFVLGQSDNENTNCFAWTGSTFENQTCEVYRPMESATPNSAYTSETFDYFRFDSIPPTVTIVSPLAQRYNVSSITFNFTLNEQGYCNYSIDGGATNYTMTSDINQFNFSATNSSVPDGNYTVRAYCRDMAGNINNNINRNFSIDATYPQISFVPATEGNDTNWSRSWIFANVTVTEENEANITFSLYNSLGGLVSADTYTNKTRSVNWSVSQDGLYYYNVTVCDQVSHCNKTGTNQIRLDDTPPVISVQQPEPIVYTINESLPLNYTVSDNFIGLSACWWNLDGGENKSIECGQNATFNASSNSTHTIYFYANDTLDNFAETNVSFFVAYESPAVTLDFPPHGRHLNYTGTVYFNYTPTDMHGISSCSLYGNWSGGWHSNQTDDDVQNATSNSFNLSYLPEGGYIWNIWCNDTVGNEAMFFENSTFTIDMTYPEIYYSSDTPGNDSNFSRSWIYVNITVNDTNFANLTFSLYNGTGGSNHVDSATYADSTRSINWTGLDDSRYYYNVTVLDKAGNENKTETRMITLDTTPPNGTLVSPPNDTYTNETLQNLTVNASDSAGLSNATLYVYNETDHLINETSQNISGTQKVLEITYLFLYDGIFKWFYRIFDVAGNYFNTANNTITIDTAKPNLQFGSGTEPNGAERERTWIYANVSVNDTNFANITFELYNEASLVNNTFFDTLITEINWTGLSSKNVTYYYNATVFDKAGNANMTETRSIKLIDITLPALTLSKPANKTYYTPYVPLQYSASDTNLENCYYTFDNGTSNTTIPNCENTTLTLSSGSYSLRLFANDSLGHFSEKNASFGVNIDELMEGIIAYGEGAVQTPRYRLWNGYNFSDELSANSIGSTNLWVRAASSPVRNEYIIVTSGTDFDVQIQVNSTLPNGTSCWHNGTSCGSVWEVTTNSSNLAFLKMDVAYETYSGDALVVWSDNGTGVKYTVWNGTNFTGIANVPQALLSGTIHYVKLESHPWRDEIALIMTNLTNLSIMIWNGSSWGCEPSALLSIPLESGVYYQHADLAYEQVSGDLFVAAAANGPNGFDYVTKQDGSCNYAVTRITNATNLVESEMIFAGAQYGSNYIIISQEDINSNYMAGIVWDGNNMLSSPARELTLIGEAVPDVLMDAIWVGMSNTALIVYSDLDYSTTFDYFQYNKTSNSWLDNSGNGYNAVGITPFSYYERNIKAYSHPYINRSMIFVQDQFNDLWAKAYDADFNEWSDLDNGLPLEDNTASTNYQVFSFNLNNDRAGPLIAVNSPIGTKNTFSITFNITSSETASCSYSLDGGGYVAMSGSANRTHYHTNRSVPNGEHNVTYQCYDKWGNVRVKNSNFTVNAVAPAISFVLPTEINDTYRSRSWIFANVTINETGFANITFSLYNGTGGSNLVNSTTYTNSTRYINWTGLSEGAYYYKVTATNTDGNPNQTETRTITLDTTSPTLELKGFPANNSADSDGIATFSYNVTDNYLIGNCSIVLNGATNQTNSTVEKNATQNFTLSGLGASGYNWSLVCIDKAENSNSSGTYFFDVVLMTGFDGATTDISSVDHTNITNLVLEKASYCKINFSESINLSGGADVGSHVSIGQNYASINSTSEPRLNKSAKISIYGLGYNYTPIVLSDGVLCSGCIIESYAEGVLVFNVTHFTNYSASSNSQLEIWDETDPEGGSEERYAGDQVIFYANYTNTTSGTPVNGTGVYCNLSFNVSGGWTAWTEMPYNQSSSLYEYNRSFDLDGNYSWNVSCNGSSLGYEALNLTDMVLIKTPYLEVYLELPPTVPGKGNAEDDGGYLVGQNRTFVIRANVTCRDGNCGNVQGFVRFNFSSASPDANMSTFPDTPFYVVNSSSGSAQNPVFCGNLDEDQPCSVNWTINSTGNLNSLWKVDAGFNRTRVSNNTDDATIKIAKILIMSLSFSEVDFGVVNPATPGDMNPAPNNGNQFVLVNQNSNAVENLWIKGTNLSPTVIAGYGNISYSIGVGNITWNNESLYSGSTSLKETYQLVCSNVDGGQNQSMHFWIAAPRGIEAQKYTGMLYFLANATY